MTRKKAIEVLQEHLEHWQRLLAEHICEKKDGKETIEALQAAIKAMQTELCEDFISRENVLKVIETVCFSDAWRKFRINYGSNGERDYIIKFIKQMPSVQPEQRWIPCEKRMPEDSKSVLFCDIDGDIMIGYHIKGRPKTHFTENVSWEDIKNVRAWMPLPEPFKAESEG